MALARATTSVLRCGRCRSEFYRNLTSLSKLETPSPAATVQRAATASRSRPLSVYTRRNSDNIPSKNQNSPGLAGVEEIGSVEDIVPNQNEDPRNSSGDSALPWYLQMQEEERDEPSRSLADRQRLPDLPPEPPPVLQTLLKHISVDLGLDDLSLLDLRDLEPPPALGSNLIMVIGTARSEKHLHVSADRFCRYLRSNHKLRAHADGLLGRGELKIRMRRQVRRARLMANVGAMDTRNKDDLRTGWVCVLVDGIEPSPDWASNVPKREDFVGFDERSDRVTLAVQMFIEEKRQDIDLEQLWTGRSQRAEKEMSEAVEEETVRKGAENDSGRQRLPMNDFGSIKPSTEVSDPQTGQLREAYAG